MNFASKIAEDFDSFKDGLPKPLEEYVLGTYGVSLESVYGKHRIKNPLGKASGQLSLNPKQIERDVEAGLGFVVLKTVIAEDEAGEQSMSAWATQDTHMTVEEITGTRSDVLGELGHTVTWKGRGWGSTLTSYLELFDQALAHSGETLIVPSCKYNLPKPGEIEWKASEYRFTTAKLYNVWKERSSKPMPLEKDFSPTLAGDGDFSREKKNILRWLSEIVQIIRNNADELSLGIKLFNASFEDAFQLEILEEIKLSSPDLIIYGNRLFDPNKVYEEKQGVAYGGPDLSSRNLWALNGARRHDNRLQVSATGNIVTGDVMFDYLKQGCSSFQMHTLFQLPDKFFSYRGRNKTERAMHHLLFDPVTGFLKRVLEEKQRRNLPDGISIGDMAELYRNTELTERT